MSNSLLIEKTVEFSKMILPFYDSLRRENHHYLADQLFRSVMAVGANVHEAQAAESRSDFIHKFKLANKEIWEAGYWFKVVSAIIFIPVELEELRITIHKMINKSIQTALQNLAAEKKTESDSRPIPMTND
jgi:four helix bundle protein